jgi:hypothetical protein
MFENVAVDAARQRRNLLTFAASTYREAARSRAEAGRWPSDVAAWVTAGCDRAEAIVGEAYRRYWDAHDALKGPAFLADCVLNASEARAALKALGAPGSAAAKIESALNTIAASVRPTRVKYLVRNRVATGFSDVDLADRARELRDYARERSVADVRKDLVEAAKRGDDEGFLACSEDPIASRRDRIFDAKTETLLLDAWLARAGMTQRVEALKEAAGLLADILRQAHAAIDAFAGVGPDADASQRFLRMGDGGELEPIA